MKLNKNGWGYRQMILMSSILLIFLLIAAYNIYALYNELDASEASVYVNLELKLQSAAANYVGDNKLENQRIIISLNELKQLKYITSFKDKQNNDCNGYVIYENYDYNSYISCPRYTSKNYNNFNQ